MPKTYVKCSTKPVRLSSNRCRPIASALLSAAVYVSLPLNSKAAVLDVDTTAGNSPYTVTGDATYTGITVGDTTTGVLNQSSNTLTATGNTYLGNAANSNGTYNLSGGTLDSTAAPNGVYVGYKGAGTFNQSGGVFSSSGRSLRIGNQAGGSGNYNLSGGTANILNLFTGQGLTTSSGSVTVTGGSLAASGNIAIGYNSSGGGGLFALSGSGVVSCSQFSVTGTATSFSVGGNGILNVSDTVFLNPLSGSKTSSITGGTVNVTSNAGTANGEFDENEGTGTQTLNISGGTTTLGGYIDAEGSSTTTSILNLSGGSVTILSTSNLNSPLTSHADFGQLGASTVNQSGGSMTVQTEPIVLGGQATAASGKATYNLTGGSLTVVGVSKGTGSGTFNFNGGTLVAGVSTTTFMTGLTAANVQAGGALVNTNGFNVTIGQALLTGTTGSPDGGLTKLGAGVLTLTAADTYTGTTTVSAGMLATGTTGTLGTGSVSVAAALSLGNATSIADTATLSFSDPSTIILNASGGSETVSSLIDSTTGKYEIPGTYTSDQLDSYFGDSVFSSPNGETLTIVAATPEPTSMMLVGLAAGGLAIRRRRAVTVTA